MSDLKRVTIGIPIFNVEKYIVRCLESVIKQDYNNIDILIMYDESSDRSLEVAESLLSNSNINYRVLLNNKNKSSIGVARNFILESFNGDYLFFLDSDDFLEPHCISHLVSLSQKYDADIVKSSHKSLNENGTILQEIRYPKEDVFENHEFKNKLYLRNYLYSYYSWNKLFKRSFIKDNHMHYIHDEVEDAFFTFSEIENAKKIAVTPNITYNYIVRPDSLTNKEATFDKISVFVDNKKLIEESYRDNEYLYAYCCRIDVFIMTYIMIVRDGFSSSIISKDQKLELLHQAFKTPNLPLSKFCALVLYKKWKVALIILVKCLPFSVNSWIVHVYHLIKGNKV